jgi:hypothetical protein
MKKTGLKFIVFLVLISLILLFVTCDDQGGGTSSSPNPSNPSGPSSPSGPSNPSNPLEPLPNNSYRVIYDKNATDATGTMAHSIFTVNYGNQYLPINNFIRNNYCFTGWAKTPTSTTAEYTDRQQFTQNLTTAGNTITLYAVWHAVTTVNVTNTDGNTLANKFTWITNNAESYTTYVIEINTDESLSGLTLSYNPKRFITIHLKGNGNISWSGYYSSNSLFTISNDVTLILDGSLTLSGSSNSSSSLIKVDSGGKFIMNGGKISGNSSNTSSYNSVGGGVYVNGAFTMNGGEISGNTASSSSYSSGGGGVYVNGTFIMNNGKISGNTANNSYSNVGDEQGGGGVYVNGAFTMNGGEISGNTSSNRGGGGVYVNGAFTMNGGEISSNTASSGGGGVYVSSLTGRSFTKTGGTITGSNAANSNLVKDGSGNFVNNKGRAVYVGGSSFEKRKETTAGPGDNLYYGYIPSSSYPYEQTWSGAWDY